MSCNGTYIGFIGERKNETSQADAVVNYKNGRFSSASIPIRLGAAGSGMWLQKRLLWSQLISPRNLDQKEVNWHMTS